MICNYPILLPVLIALITQRENIVLDVKMDIMGIRKIMASAQNVTVVFKQRRATIIMENAFATQKVYDFLVFVLFNVIYSSSIFFQYTIRSV